MATSIRQQIVLDTPVQIDWPRVFVPVHSNFGGTIDTTKPRTYSVTLVVPASVWVEKMQEAIAAMSPMLAQLKGFPPLTVVGKSFSGDNRYTWGEVELWGEKNTYPDGMVRANCAAQSGLAPLVDAHGAPIANPPMPDTILEARAPTILDRDGTRLTGKTGENLIRSGTFVQAVVTIYTRQKPSLGFSVGFSALRMVSQGEAFSSTGISADEAKALFGSAPPPPPGSLQMPTATPVAPAAPAVAPPAPPLGI